MATPIKVNDLYENKSKHKVELLTFIYGSLIVRLTKDIQDLNEINKQIELMGCNIGKRLIDDIIDDTSKNGISNSDLVKQLIVSVFRNYLGVYSVTCQQKNEKEYRIIFPENPLNLYVELPEKFKDLWYSNILCGIVRGLLEIVNYEVECIYLKDKLKGDDTNEIQVNIKQIIEERFIDDEE